MSDNLGVSWTEEELMNRTDKKKKRRSTWRISRVSTRSIQLQLDQAIQPNQNRRIVTCTFCNKSMQVIIETVQIRWCLEQSWIRFPHKELLDQSDTKNNPIPCNIYYQELKRYYVPNVGFFFPTIATTKAQPPERASRASKESPLLRPGPFFSSCYLPLPLLVRLPQSSRAWRFPGESAHGQGTSLASWASCAASPIGTCL